MKRKYTVNQRGITMVSLVMTIVVMIILSSITITSVVGENGLLSKMRGVKNSSEKRVAMEELKSDIILHEVSNGAISDDLLFDILSNYGTVTYEEDGTTMKGVIISTGEEILLSEIWNGTIIPAQGEKVGTEEEIPPLVTTNLSAVTNGKRVDLSIGVTDEESGFGKVEFMHKSIDAQSYTNSTFGTGGEIWAVDEQTVTATIYLSDGRYNIKAKVYDAAKNYIETDEITIEVIGFEQPVLSKGMVPVKYDGTNWKVTSSNDIDWYNYEEEDLNYNINGAAVTTEARKWANIMLMDGLETNNHTNEQIKTYNTPALVESNLVGDTVTEMGSMFVWIPRFEYKITSAGSNPAGTVDIHFINAATTAKTTGYVTASGYTSIEDNNIGAVSDGTVYNEETKYIIHPAFRNEYTDDDDNTNDFKNGGWDSELSGIWVAKFEASNDNSSKVKIVPNISSWRGIIIGDMYTYCRNMTGSDADNYGFVADKDSEIYGATGTTYAHLMKNSEWGAVAYLTHSKYGRNRTEVSINANSSYYTGGGENDTYVSNVEQSSTGNVYGIYDMSGGANEYVAAYNMSESDLTNGSSFVSSSNNNTKYATIYGFSDNSSSASNYKTGDATYEVYKVGNKSWFNDYYFCSISSNPFFRRGGNYTHGSLAGAFYASIDGGGSATSYSFRPALAVL